MSLLDGLQAMLALDFMRNAFLAGGCIAVAAGLTGYFVVLRNQVFTTDALGHAGFTGGLGGLLAGVGVLPGVFLSCAAAALGMGALGGRGRARDVAAGTVFAWLLGLGALFLGLYTTSLSAASGGAVGIRILFGSVLSLGPGEVLAAALAAAATAAAVLALARPLLFLSLDPDVAEARGVPARAVSAAFLLLVALTVAEAVQVVGALLIFALLVIPAGAAQNLTARPWAGLGASCAIALGAVWAGLVLAYVMPYPPSFFITALAFGFYLATEVGRRSADGRRTAGAS